MANHETFLHDMRCTIATLKKNAVATERKINEYRDVILKERSQVNLILIPFGFEKACTTKRKSTEGQIDRHTFRRETLCTWD